jgi:hypothetical protein
VRPSSVPVGPESVPRLASSPAGPDPFSPGWAAIPLSSCSGWASRLASLWLGRQADSRLDLLGTPSGWAGMSSPAGPGYLPRLGRLASSGPGLPQAGTPRHVGIYLFRLGLYQCTVPAGPGFPSRGRIITLQGQDLLPPDHFHHLASTPSPCVSSGMLLGSNWHIIHHRMLVLGRPLAETSILHLS